MRIPRRMGSRYFVPTMDGRETMRLVRELNPAIPIATSGRPMTPDSGPEPDFRTTAAKLVAVGNRSKPFKPADLLAKVADGLAASDQATSPTDAR
jgi:CheY-like chemotaxis protein